MAGVKGMKTGGSKNAGRPKKEQQTTSTEVAVELTTQDIIDEIERRLKSARQRALAYAMAAYDSDVETFKLMEEMGMLPPSYYKFVDAFERTVEKLNTAKQLQLPATSPLLLSISTLLNNIEQA